MSSEQPHNLCPSLLSHTLYLLLPLNFVNLIPMVATSCPTPQDSDARFGALPRGVEPHHLHGAVSDVPLLRPPPPWASTHGTRGQPQRDDNNRDWVAFTLCPWINNIVTTNAARITFKSLDLVI